MLTFNYTSNAYEVTGQVAPLETDIIIPSTFDDGVNGEFPVTSIGAYAFQFNQLTSVVIPDSVISIGGAAFYGNQFTSVTIPNSVTSIGTYAFRENQLTSVTIPDSVISMGGNAFQNNQLTTVVWKTSMTIPASTFTGINNKITSFTITSDTLITLESTNTFSDVTTENPMSVYVQPQLVEDYKTATNWSILYNDGKATFEPIPAPQITKLKPYLTAIKEAIQFKNGTTGNVNVQDMPQMIRDLPSGGGGLDYLMRTSTPVDSKAILTQDGDGTLHAEIPDSVTSIGVSAFRYNQLTSVTIPNSVESIGNYAFQSNQLTSVTIPNSVESIGTYAFQSNQLTSVIIPNSVESIGNSAFSGNLLTSVIIPDNVTSIGNSVFLSNQLTSVVWETTSQIQSSTFSDSTNKITSFTITSESLVSLQNINAFSEIVSAENPMTVYVQPQLIEDYKTATNWVTLYNNGRCDFVDIALAPTE